LNTVQEIKSTEDTVTGANAMYKDEKLHEWICWISTQDTETGPHVKDGSHSLL
jgi:hypothetical protein